MADDEAPTRRHCAASELHRQLLSVDPDYRLARQEIEDQTDAEQARGFAAAVSRTRTIPSWCTSSTRRRRRTSPTRRSTARSVLNEDFRKTNADRQVPAAFKPLHADCADRVRARDQGRLRRPQHRHHAHSRTNVPRSASTTGQVEPTGGADPWPARPLPEHLGLHLGGGLLGYAQFPGGPRATDGVVILNTAFGDTGTAAAPFNLGRTATHEVGHWLNLRHIWGDDGTGCTARTTAPTRPTRRARTRRAHVPAHLVQQRPNGDLFMDYMDYVDDNAMFMFTAGQATRMNATLNGPRKLLFEHAAVPRRARAEPRRSRR